MVSQKVVTPVKTGVQNLLGKLDSGFRRNDAKREILTSNEVIFGYTSRPLSNYLKLHAVLSIPISRSSSLLIVCRLRHKPAFYEFIKDGFAKSRHSGENRSPERFFRGYQIASLFFIGFCLKFFEKYPIQKHKEVNHHVR